MKLYSDGKRVIKPTDIISNSIWRGIVAEINSLISEDSLSKNFPAQCIDGNGTCGFNQDLFRDSLRAYIKGMDYPFPSIIDYEPQEYNNVIGEPYLQQLDVLDTIEFVYSNLCDAIKSDKRYHHFFNHYHLLFEERGKAKQRFKAVVNEIFQRNGISFFLNDDGHVERLVPEDLAEQIVFLPNIEDITTREHLQIAIEKYRSPKFEERRIALERLWDAFERIKTLYNKSVNKGQSADELLNAVSGNNENYKTMLAEECKALTDIGNHYQIRHHEVDKVPIDNDRIIDFFFTRMKAMINLLLTAFPSQLPKGIPEAPVYDILDDDMPF